MLALSTLEAQGEDTDTLPKIYIQLADDVLCRKLGGKGMRMAIPRSASSFRREFRQGLAGNVVFSQMCKEADRQRKHTEEQQQGV